MFVYIILNYLLSFKYYYIVGCKQFFLFIESQNDIIFRLYFILINHRKYIFEKIKLQFVTRFINLESEIKYLIVLECKKI